MKTHQEFADSIFDRVKKNKGGLIVFQDFGTIRSIIVGGRAAQKFFTDGAPGMIGLYRLTSNFRPGDIRGWILEDITYYRGPA